MKQPWTRAIAHTIAVASLATSLATHAQTTKIGLTQNPEIFRIVKIFTLAQPSEPMDFAVPAACNGTAFLSSGCIYS